VTRELNNISETAFLEGMKKFKERATKRIDQGGMYFKNKNKSFPYKKLSVFYNSCLQTFGSHLVCIIIVYVNLLHMRSVASRVIDTTQQRHFFRVSR